MRPQIKCILSQLILSRHIFFSLTESYLSESYCQSIQWTRNLTVLRHIFVTFVTHVFLPLHISYLICIAIAAIVAKLILCIMRLRNATNFPNRYPSSDNWAAQSFKLVDNNTAYKWLIKLIVLSYEINRQHLGHQTIFDKKIYCKARDYHITFHQGKHTCRLLFAIMPNRLI